MSAGTAVTYWKAVRPDGTDTHTGTVQWAPPPGHEGEWIVRHPTASSIGDDVSEYLSVATAPTDCTGMKWPCRLLEVEAVGEVTTPNLTLPHKRTGVAFRVLREAPATEALGPHGEHVAALIRSIPDITRSAAERLALAWDAAWDVARYVARDAAWDAARAVAWYAAWDAARAAAWYAAWDAARAAARDAALALLVRDLITTEHYDTLTRPWRTAIGPIHPDDPAL